MLEAFPDGDAFSVWRSQTALFRSPSESYAYSPCRKVFFNVAHDIACALRVHDVVIRNEKLVYAVGILELLVRGRGKNRPLFRAGVEDVDDEFKNWFGHGKIIAHRLSVFALR